MSGRFLSKFTCGACLSVCIIDNMIFRAQKALYTMRCKVIKLKMKNRVCPILSFNIFFLVIGFVLFEVSVRFLIDPSPISFGRLFGKELPPINLIPREIPPEPDRDDWVNGIIVKGKKITIGDLWGIQIEDELLGYEPAPNAASLNGWWKSNNIGAISSYRTEKSVASGATRVLIFGDSFAQGSRVSLEESWHSVLQSLQSDLEVVNLGVDGYSVAQSYLRYQKIRELLDFDIVILLLSPRSGLWRGINVFRSLVVYWGLYNMMPRYVVRSDELQLVTSPYASKSEFLENNVGELSVNARKHLSLYDSFYPDSCYDTPYDAPFLFGDLVSYKIVYQYFCDKKRNDLLNSLYDTQGEALQVYKRIFQEMKIDIEINGGDFYLLILPEYEDVRELKSNDAYINIWNKMTSFLCSDGLKCLDLKGVFQNLPMKEIDRGYDQSHYGPIIHRKIAQQTKEFLAREKLRE